MAEKPYNSQDKWDDMEWEATDDPAHPPRPSWDVNEINKMTRPGKGAQDPRSRAERRRKAVWPK